MNVGESHELLTQFRQDLTAETDPDRRTWYEQEFKLQPEYSEAIGVRDQLTALAMQLGKLAQIKSEQVINDEPKEANEPIEPDATEKVKIPTAEEILAQKIQKKCETEYKIYEDEVAGLSGMKKSRREHEERKARRSFARRLTDFSEVTGHKHVVLDANSSLLLAVEIIEDDSLIAEVFASCADYSERYGVEVTADPKNFATIIAGTVSENPFTYQFENILKSIYSTRHNVGNFATINQNLAGAAFELLASTRALAKVVSIAFGKEPYITSQHHYEYIKHAMEAYLAGDFQNLVDDRQAFIIFGILNNDITGQNLLFTEGMEAGSRKIQEEYRENMESLRTRPDFFTSLIFQGNTIRDFDPVSVSSLTDEPLDLHHRPAPDELRTLLPNSQLFRKRMQEFAPYTYSVLAAKSVTESEKQNQPETVHGVSISVSPSIVIDIYTLLKGRQFEPTNQQTDLMYGRIREIMPELLRQIAGGINIASYEQAGELKMVYRPLFDNNPRTGAVIFRPAIEIDRKNTCAIQYLTINYCKLRTNEPTITKNDNLFEMPVDEYGHANEELRQMIKEQQKRLLGRRPVKFSMSEHFRMAGLNSISLRYDPKKDRTVSLFELDDGPVELQLDEDFNIDMTDGPTTEVHDRMKLYYENIILKHAQHWLCEREVHTSEGIVSDESGNAANMGHFGYLRIKNGARWKHSPRQAKNYLEERRQRGTTLAQESARLALLSDAIDEATGLPRNSTYYRENYDPNKPPLEVYYPTLD
jgi:hypothetical protein